LQVDRAARVTGATGLAGNLSVAGATDLRGNTQVGGDLQVAGTARVTGVTELAGSLSVAGATNLGGNTQVHGDVQVNGIINATDIHKGGAPLPGSQWDDVPGGISYAAGNVGIGTDTPGARLHVAGDIQTEGDLLVTGAANVSGNLSVAGTVDGRDISADGTKLDTHVVRRDNPHGVTAAQVEALRSIDGISNPGGDVDLVASNTITISADNANQRITIGESHSARTNNPHGVTAAQVGALTSVDGVSNAGGNVDLVASNAITITPDDANNRITIGENHSTRRDNPHGVTATQVGALSVAGGTLSGDLNVTGKVGIGTTSPQGTLDVAGGDSALDALFVKASPTVNDQGGIIHHQGSTYAWQEVAQSTASTSGTLEFNYVNRTAPGTKVTSNALVLSGNGNVGIGTAAPQQKLHVAGSYIRVDGAGNEQIYIGGDGAGNDVQIGSFNSNVSNVAVWNATTNTRMNLYVNHLIATGDIRFTGNLIGGGKGGYVMDQFVNNLGEALEQGDVVVIGENRISLYYGPNNNIPIPEVDLAQRAYDVRVCGVVCEVYMELKSETSEEANPGAEGKKPKKAKATRGRGEPEALQPRAFTPEELEKLDRTKIKPGQIGWMVTLGAFAHCKVDADIAPIQVGDLLTTSPTKGHAQKVLDPGQMVGVILGKALGSLNKGKGKIPVLVMLQ
jgi:cytoskeletal protein CcmA (bactofilin family)